jgi:Ca-activated chloride channel family protein
MPSFRRRAALLSTAVLPLLVASCGRAEPDGKGEPAAARASEEAPAPQSRAEPADAAGPPPVAADGDAVGSGEGRNDKIVVGEAADPLGGILAEEEADREESKPEEPVTPQVAERPKDAETSRSMYFEHYGVNPTIETTAMNVSTFAVDVDTASYAMTRSFLGRDQMPPEASVRVEEIVNYFDYLYTPPEEGDFSLHAEVVPSPQRTGYHVLHLGLKGKEVAAAARPSANLVFVIDVSGSMASGNRLGMVKDSLRLLVEELGADDFVGIVAYGSRARVVLPPTTGAERAAILAAIDGLRTEGSTNVEAGLELGYEQVAKQSLGAGINRVILCSDGVANTGSTKAEEILEKVAEHAARGVTISTIGVGMGNYNDTMMEKLANKGNGNYAYVDGLEEAKRVFVEHLTGTLQVIAKDVKIQVEFDKDIVARYRLLGYENRAMAARDFADDTKDAGEIGAGHTVTALYEVKFKDPEAAQFGVIRVRYKKPRGNKSTLLEKPLPGTLIRDSYADAAPPTRLSLVAATYAEKLRGSYWVRNLTWGEIREMYDGIPRDLRSTEPVAELGRLIDTAARLDRRSDKFESDLPLAQMNFDRVPVLK